MITKIWALSSLNRSSARAAFMVALSAIRLRRSASPRIASVYDCAFESVIEYGHSVRTNICRMGYFDVTLLL